MILIAKISAGLLIFCVLFFSGLNVCAAGYATEPSGLLHEEMMDSRILSIKEVEIDIDLINEIDEDLLRDIDRDNDGSVSLSEWLETGGSETLFQVIDQNNDSYLTADDLYKDSPFPFSIEGEEDEYPSGCRPVNLFGEWFIVCWC